MHLYMQVSLLEVTNFHTPPTTIVTDILTHTSDISLANVDLSLKTRVIDPYIITSTYQFKSILCYHYHSIDYLAPYPPSGQKLLNHRSHISSDSVSPATTGYSTNVCGINKWVIYFMIQTPILSTTQSPWWKSVHVTHFPRSLSHAIMRINSKVLSVKPKTS